MLASVLLHVVAAPVRIDRSSNFGAWGKYFVQPMPDFAFFIFKNVFYDCFEKDTRFRLRADSSDVKRLATAGGIKSSSVEPHRPTGLIAITL
jgi:hypothetical protein